MARWQQSITWANVDGDLCRFMASQGHSELTHQSLVTSNGVIELGEHCHVVMKVIVVLLTHCSLSDVAVILKR